MAYTRLFAAETLVAHTAGEIKKLTPLNWGEFSTRVATQIRPKTSMCAAQKKQKALIPLGTRTIPALPPMLPSGQL
jgi:hypothetical protein